MKLQQLQRMQEIQLRAEEQMLKRQLVDEHRAEEQMAKQRQLAEEQRAEEQILKQRQLVEELRAEEQLLKHRQLIEEQRAEEHILKQRQLVNEQDRKRHHGEEPERKERESGEDMKIDLHEKGGFSLTCQSQNLLCLSRNFGTKNMKQNAPSFLANGHRH